MNTFLRRIGAASVLALAAMGAASQAAPPPRAAGEIEGLIAALGASGCQFQRNGRWYAAAEAQSHLRRKYDWLVKRDLVASAEQFIERAGSGSSLSGQAYRVRCQGQPMLSSAAWLTAKLAELRRGAQATGRR